MQCSPSNQPRALWILSFGKIWDTLSYYGAQTILVLYLMHIFHFSHTTSYLVYGVYAAFSYSTPILGGIIADKWLKSQHLLVVGSMLKIIGNLFLLTFNQYLFCLGLATTIIGSGLYRGTSTYLVGTLYPENTNKKEAGFTWIYLAVNFGAMIAPLLYGWLAYRFSWNLGFLCSAIGISISTLWFVYAWPSSLYETSAPQVKNTYVSLFIYLMILLCCPLLSIPFYFPVTAHFFVIAVISTGIIYLGCSLQTYRGQERNKLMGLLFICFFAMFYFAIGLQIGTSITLFIQHEITRNIIKISLPASVFSTLYPLFVLVLSPFLSYLWQRLENKKIPVHIVTKLILGIGCAGLGMVAFIFATSTELVLSGIITGILFLSAGELIISPAVYTAISNFAPAGMKNTMMGSWLLCIALGSYVSSLLTNLPKTATNHFFYQSYPFFCEFLFLALFTLLVLTVLIAFSGKLKRMFE